ncbi:MAG: hypothetical protein AABX88_00380 [Nanoarchaeota archaeon]
MTLLKEIQSAQPGSDIYELVVKIIIYSDLEYYIKNPLNVKTAQKKFMKWVRQDIPEKTPLDLYLKEWLRDRAYIESQKHEEITPFDNWINAVNKLGSFIAKNY